MATIPNPNNFVRILAPLQVASDMSAIQNSSGGDALTTTDVTDALGYTPYNAATNPAGYLTSATVVTNDAVIGALGYTPVNKAGDSMAGSLSLPKEPGTAIKIDNGYGWHDLIGNVTPRPSSTAAPSLTVFRGAITEYAYGLNDAVDLRFHIPHDHVPNSDLFIHVHWSHNGTAIAGSFQATFTATYSKGHQQASFPAPITAILSVQNLSIVTTPQYFHRVDEIQLSTLGGSASQINSADIETDGMILINCVVTTLPSISGGTSNRPFITAIDIHYQSTNIATKNKSPNFYG